MTFPAASVSVTREVVDLRASEMMGMEIDMMRRRSLLVGKVKDGGGRDGSEEKGE